MAKKDRRQRDRLLSGWVMVLLVFLMALALRAPPPTIDRNSLADTSRTRGPAEVHREQDRNRPVQQEAEGGLFLNQETVLERMISGRGGAGGRIAAIDSLLKVHPRLKGLVLRALLMPRALPGFFASSPPSASETWRLAGISRTTPFERGGLMKTRQMEIHDTWTEGRILAPQIDIKRTVRWILDLLE
jgi:hypothetical protein